MRDVQLHRLCGELDRLAERNLELGRWFWATSRMWEPGTLRQLLDFSAQNPQAICQPAVNGRTGHPVILPRPGFLELPASGTATLKDFLNLATLPRVQWAVHDTGLPLDMDTPEDYKRLQVSYCTE